MNRWTHPTLGPIDPIAKDKRAEKVWRHLYGPYEHWERLCDADVAAMRNATERTIGVERAEKEKLPLLDSSTSANARQLMLAHHDDAYAIAYLQEMSSL